MEEKARFLHDDAEDPASAEVWDAMAYFFRARAEERRKGAEYGLLQLLV